MTHIGRIFARLAGGACLLAIAGCGAPLYNVAPLPAGAPGRHGLRADAGRALGRRGAHRRGPRDRRVRRQPPPGRDVAVDLQLANGAAEQVKVDRLKPTLEDAAGQSYRPIKPQWALGRLMESFTATAPILSVPIARRAPATLRSRCRLTAGWRRGRSGAASSSSACGRLDRAHRARASRSAAARRRSNSN